MKGAKYLKNTVAAIAIGGSALAVSALPASADTYHWLSSRSADMPTMVAMKAVIDKFRETNPDFNIEIEHTPNRPAYLQKVKILATSGELPELFDADAEPYFNDIVDAGLVANIGDVFADLEITDKFVPFALDYERLDDGSLWLIPLQSNVEYFFYNTALFEQAGVEPPATLDGLKDVCATLAANEITPISVDGKDGWPIYRYLSFPAWRMEGNPFLDNLKVGKASMLDPAGIASAQFLQDIGTKCFQKGFTSADYAASLDLFTSGGAAIYYVGTWQLASFVDDTGELLSQFGYFKMPVIEGEDATTPNDFYAHSGIGTAVRADAMTGELKEFLTFFAAEYGNIALYDFNSLSSLKTEVRPELSQFYKDILSDMAAVGEYTKVWDVKLDAATVDVLFRQSQLLALGDITPEQFGEEIDASIQKHVSGR